MGADREDVRDLARAVLRLVEEAGHGMARRFDPVRMGILRQAVVHGQVRPSDLAEHLDVNPSTVTRHVQALEDAGLVAVLPDLRDRRSCLIAPTTEGVVTAQQFEDIGVDVFCTVVADWSPDEVRALTTALGRLSGAWQARGDQASQTVHAARKPRWRS